MNTIVKFEPKHILCPVDFSELSDLALKYAAVGAHEYGAKLLVLHAETFELPRYFSQSKTEQLLEELATAKERVKADLSQHVVTVLGGAVSKSVLEYEIAEAHPVEAILTSLEKEAIDLIVLGTHGYGGLKRLLLGSVAENVVRNAKVPVFTVRQKEHEFIDTTLSDSVPELKRILCPVNITEVAGIALGYAVSLSERFHARLTVLYSDESVGTVGRSRSETELRDWISKTVRTKCDTEPVVRAGEAAAQIIEQAREEKDDLIVLGALYRSFGDATYFGRTTDLVLRHAPVPVLIIPRFVS